MKHLVAALALLALVGCANAPKSRDPSALLQDKGSPDVVRADVTVPVPFESAYRNVLRAARACWSRAGATGFMSAHWTVDTDFDLAQRIASIQVTDPGVWSGSVLTAVELRAAGNATRIKAAAIAVKGVTLPGAPELQYLGNWARGETAPCSSPNFLL